MGAAAARSKYVPQAGPPQDIACGASVTLGTCGTAAGLPAGTTFVWKQGLNSVAAGLTPTLTPTAPSTTYTLTAIVPGLGALNCGQTTITINGQQPCPTGCHLGSYYSNSNDYSNPYGPDYEIGDASNTSAVPQIDLGGGVVTFDGLYHVVGPVEFIHGEVELAPGTVFYVDGGTNSWPTVSQGVQCYTNILDGYIHLFVGEGALLHLKGATLTADCDEMWGGVELVDNGRILTEQDLPTQQRSRISEARVGVLLGTPCRSTEAMYYLTDTDFSNNTYGVAVLGNDRQMYEEECRIEHCYFDSNHTTRLAPDNDSQYGDGEYTRAGLVLRGDWHQDIPYRDNTFSGLYVGAELAGEGILFDHNQLENCYGAAIRVGAPGVTQPITLLTVRENHISVPDFDLPDGQVPPDTEVKGIELLDMPQSQVPGNELYVEQNTIVGVSRGNAQKPLIGLDGYFCFQGTFIKGANAFHVLDQGVRLTDASAQLGLGQVVADNYFEDCDKAVYLHGQNSAGPFAPTVTCNSIEATDVGIFIENGADVGDLGTNTDPGSNSIQVNLFSVDNRGVNTIYYYYDDDRSENISITGPVGLVAVTGAHSCQDRTYVTYGLNRNNSTVSTAMLAAWRTQLLNAQGTPQELRRVERQLLTYYARNEQWTALDSFVTALPQLNPAAFERLSLALLHAYRAAGQPADVQRVRTALLAWGSNSSDLQQRIAYFDVSGRLGLLVPGQRPTAADSAALATVAGSTAGFAPVACATLRYYYPQIICAPTPPLLPRPAARPAAGTLAAMHPAATQSLQLRALPNPASETVQLQATGTRLASGRVELLELATGRTVLTQLLPADGHALPVDVRPLAPGVYAARLFEGTRLRATTKVVVVR